MTETDRRFATNSPFVDVWAPPPFCCKTFDAVISVQTDCIRCCWHVL